MTLRTTLLADAAATIAGPREQEYGNKLQNFSQIAALWQVLLAGKLRPGARVTPEDVGMLMIAVKLARLTKTPNHRDSLLDIAGYAGCIDELQLQRAATGVNLVIANPVESEAKASELNEQWHKEQALASLTIRAPYIHPSLQAKELR